MRRAILSFVALLLLVGPAAAEPPKSGHPVFDRVVDLVMDRFYDEAELGGFEETVRKHVEHAEAPVTINSPDSRVDAAIDEVLASLRASHTGRYERDSIDYFELADIFRYALRNTNERLFPPDGRIRYHGIGMVTQPVGGSRFVSDVYDGGPAARAGILVGDEILAVDGAPYHEIESFRGKAGQSVEIRLRRHAGAEPMNLKVEVRSLRPLPTFEKAIENSISATKHDGRKIGYVRLWTLATSDGLDILARELATGELKDADGLVVDLRGRWGGGSADAAELLVGDTPSFRLVERSGEEVLANVRWRRPVVGIIDEGTRSGLEVFAYALRMNGIPLVGERTAGALLAGRGFLLPDDSLLVLAVSDALIDEDVRLEGVGVSPDISVSFKLPYAAGDDPQRAAAVEEIRRVLARG